MQSAKALFLCGFAKIAITILWLGGISATLAWLAATTSTLEREVSNASNKLTVLVNAANERAPWVNTTELAEVARLKVQAAQEFVYRNQTWVDWLAGFRTNQTEINSTISIGPSPGQLPGTAPTTNATTTFPARDKRSRKVYRGRVPPV